MNRKPKLELMDAENPTWTKAEADKALSFAELPNTLQYKLSGRTRGAQLNPIKSRITIRLSPNVVDSFKATGIGWQTRIDVALQDWLKTHSL